MPNDEEAKWYVVHTYSGYENKVATDLEKIVESRGLQELILDIKIPTETVTEIKDSKTREIERKLYPGYVLIKMVINDDSWYVVRNTRGVTGFVGSGTKPVPLTEAEVEKLGFDKRIVEVNYAVGDNIQIIDGPLDGFKGVVESIDTVTNSVRVVISMFGRETPVELELEQVSPVE